MINHNRLAETFRALVEIDSESKGEGHLCAEIAGILETLGAETVVDDAGEKIGADTGNLIARFRGDINVPAMLLNAHMDTVKPGTGVRAVLKDGVFTSRGETILGADDKSAIAVMIEVMRVIKENNLPHAPIELVFTVCEEIGLLGAKQLDLSLLQSRFGYALDATDTQGIITHAPAANRIEARVHGRDAHSGASPEKGISAIHAASMAISKLTLGRIDRDTTCNIGMIEGGKATNIVPSLVTVRGEVRSHDEEKLNRYTDDMINTFTHTMDNYRATLGEERLPKVDFDIKRDFAATRIPNDHPVVVLAQKAAANLGMEMKIKKTGGGADANVFFAHGLVTGVLGTGMRDVHTVRESVRVTDMVRLGDLVLEMINLHSTGAYQVIDKW